MFFHIYPFKLIIYIFCVFFCRLPTLDDEGNERLVILSYKAARHLAHPAESLLITVYVLRVCGPVLSCCAVLMLCFVFVGITPSALFFRAL